MTEKQKDLYMAIKSFINKCGYAPTVRELCEMTNVKSPATTFAKLIILKRKGYITYVEGKSRTIKILK